MQLETALHILGIEGLRPFQEEALNTLLADRSLLTLMPTSAGKSLIFTTFAMVQERLTIVIEPHLALELDQVRQLQGKGVAAACLNSLQSSAERKSVLAQIEQGELLLLFITPEMLQNRKVQTALRQSDLAGVMIDSGGPCPTLYAGGEVVILRDFAPRTCLEYAEKYAISFLIGVPTIIAMPARTQERSPADLSALRGIVTMGAPFEKSACEKYMKLLTPNIFNGYGTTETFWNTFLRPFDLPDNAGSAGRSCTDDEVRLVALRPDGERSEPDETVPRDSETPGEIIISSPAKSAFCYFNNEEMTEKKFYKGWLYTGDVGTWDENEFVTVSGRRDDMIVSAGENIYPAQIEAVLNEHPKVAESAVIGIPDKLRGEVVAAYVVAKEPSLTVEELKDYCTHSPMLSSYKWPRAYHIVD